MSHTVPPLETVWELISDIQANQQRSERRIEEQTAALGIGYAFAFAALAESVLEADVVDRERLKAWLAASIEQAERHFDHPLTLEVLAQIYNAIEQKYVLSPQSNRDRT